MPRAYAVHDSPDLNTRIRVVRAFLFFCLFGVLARLFYWQIMKADDLRSAAESQYSSIYRTTGSRGSILTADGYALAANQDVYTLFAQPKLIEKTPEEIADQLAPMIAPLEETDSATVSADTTPILPEDLLVQWKKTIIEKLRNSSLSWVSLKRKIPRDVKDQMVALNITGIGFDQEEMRYYPEASMAAQVLGFVGNDARGQEQGYFGIEGLFDRELRGRAGVVKQEKDAAGLPIAIGGYDAINAQDGRDLVLTIRRDLQFMLEDQLKKGMVRYGSKTAEAVIMDPKTGAILAMAAFPNYDPAKFYQFDPQLYKNPIVNDVYEPGSTMKIFTVSAGIDTGAITPEMQCDQCTGPRVISGYTIKTWNNEYTPNTTMLEGLVRSDNTAMIFAAERMGLDTYVKELRKFGFGEKTNIDLQEEALPPFRDTWKELDMATASFGQGIAVTGIQMLRVAQAIANRGVMMRPMIVQAVKQDDRTITVQPKEYRQVMSLETAQTVTGMMEQSALHGDAKWAIPKGYRIAGKTGTAQVAVAGHYDAEKTVASFIGFAPAEDPKFVMLVKLREPSSSPWGSETAAPLWFSIARQLFLRMNIAPSR